MEVIERCLGHSNRFIEHAAFLLRARLFLDRDNSVGIATHYGLDGPEFESRWRRSFPHSSRPHWVLPSLLYSGYRVIPGGKVAGEWR